MEWHGRAKAGLIARCIDVSDVRAAIRAATDTRILSALRSGGHSLAGFSTCDRGLVIDLSRMREVTVDPDARRARVVVGCLLGSIDTNTQKTGLVFPRVSSPTPELLDSSLAEERGGSRADSVYPATMSNVLFLLRLTRPSCAQVQEKIRICSGLCVGAAATLEL